MTVYRNRTLVSISSAKWRMLGLALGSDPRWACPCQEALGNWGPKG